MTNHDSKKASRQGATRQRKVKVSVRMLQEAAPRLPHERDESVDSQPTAPKQVIRQAAIDLKRGQTDTDRSAQMNQTYRKLKGSS